MKLAGGGGSIQGKLAGSFLLVGAFVAAYVVAAITMQMETIERAAALEGEHVAEIIGTAGMANRLDTPAGLQEYIARLNTIRKRDVVVVDAKRRGLADADEAEVGQVYDHDPDGEVAKSIEDGKTRLFIEKNDLHPEGALQVVVPIRRMDAHADDTLPRAVILEYTPIREDLLGAVRVGLLVTAIAGILVVLFATIFGVRIAKRIASPLRALRTALERMAAEDYSTRVVVDSKDEIGLLSTAFNKMAEDLDASHAQIREHQTELEQRIVARTTELSQANERLQEETRGHRLTAERAEYLAYYDNLTALPNRGMFSKVLNHCLNLCRRQNQQAAVLFVDLDRFKNINDTLGHAAGDLLLQEIAKRITSSLRESDTVARLGGDEFVVLLPNINSGADAASVAHKILSVTSKSFVALGQEFHVTASIGISTFPADGDDERTLMKNADIAMYQAKEEGKNNFQFYSEALNANSFERLALESNLRRALDRGEFELHYQPKIDAASTQIVGTEALIRWNHPELGMVGPIKFIPVAEETGLIVAIGKWVLKTACAQNVAWQKQGLPHLTMAVNLSGRQFLDENLLRDVTSILHETGMSASLLELEITESTLMSNVKAATRILEDLRDMGVRLAVDDFGTGYSSLSNLKRFPIDTIKVDRSFIRDLPNDPESRGITEAIIAMGKALSMTVIAEGVETQEQAEYLREHACNEFQGFYFAKGVPADAFSTLLKDQMSEPAAAEKALTPA